MSTLNFTSYLLLHSHLDLYLPKNAFEALRHQGFSELPWQHDNHIQPLNNVAGWIPTALCYDLGGSNPPDLVNPRYQEINMARAANPKENVYLYARRSAHEK